MNSTPAMKMGVEAVPLIKPKPITRFWHNSRKTGSGMMSITMRDRSKNRKPLQKGRNLSIEAIQTVQALKRAVNSDVLLEQLFDTKFRRLLKFDMLAVLRELLRQNQCLLALKVFKDVRKEYWYKPQLSLYAEMVTVLGGNGLLEKVEFLVMELKSESNLEPDVESFNALLESLMNFGLAGLAMECFYLMKSSSCDPDRLSFKILINGLESTGDTNNLAIVQKEAQKYYGNFLNFFENEENVIS
ncbi:Vacuolar sorting protein 9 (VPS9) domain [Abeliophyllum distichum]|uniref:Vacuolar sorting protein 9 (VPS9) domain n=1 Tax=Abeliophyllum distichum TaxID=126358 RepID=A0ABD1VZF8_9LAMI